jgi:hypothetical protein
MICVPRSRRSSGPASFRDVHYLSPLLPRKAAEEQLYAQRNQALRDDLAAFLRKQGADQTSDRGFATPGAITGSAVGASPLPASAGGVAGTPLGAGRKGPPGHFTSRRSQSAASRRPQLAGAVHVVAWLCLGVLGTVDVCLRSVGLWFSVV